MDQLKKYFLFFVLIGVISSGAFAQAGKDLQLADQFFADGDYQKAVELYEKIYEKNPQDFEYSSYLKCLLAMKDYKAAEKLAKKQIRSNSLQPQYGIDLGFIYASASQPDKAKEQYEKVIKGLGEDQNEYIRVSNAFIAYRDYDRAIDTYQKGKKNLRGLYSFHFELAELFYAKRDYTSMIGEYFEALDENPGYMQMIQNNLQSKIGNESSGKNYDNLRIMLLKEIQRYPDKPVYAELLLWYFQQEKDFESAFIQAKALDMRNHEDGARVMMLADMSASNEYYDVAIKAYQYVISKGSNYVTYNAARMYLLDVLNKKLLSKAGYTQQDLLNLESDYLKTIDELGKNAGTVPMIRGFAHLLAFYLDKAEQAQNILEEAIRMPGVQPQPLAECKLELGDILLFRGDIWESTLLYSQVDKAFHDDPLGMEAKFRNARLSFFNGEFEWALAQLTVLKSATSQLISNDAISLSLLITDNTAFDTTTDALMMYSRNDLLFYQGKDSLAILGLDSLLKEFHGHPLADDALYLKYLIRKKQFRLQEAAALLEDIIHNYSDGVLADDALYNLAVLNEEVFKQPAKAMELYQQLLTSYPASSFVVDARKRFRNLRGDQLN